MASFCTRTIFAHPAVQHQVAHGAGCKNIIYYCHGSFGFE
jgi:hypothetical protein